MGHRITTLYAFAGVDAQGEEGVLRRSTPIGTQPMIADSMDRLEQFRADAIAAADALGLRLTVIRFDRAPEGK